MFVLSACSEEAARGDDPRDAAKVTLGAKIYAQQCAACHGAKLEGQPNWRARLPNDRLPAPPHDESGHTWHHALKDYESDRPAFAGKLSDDEIWAVLAYLKTHWTSAGVLAARAEITRNAAAR